MGLLRETGVSPRRGSLKWWLAAALFGTVIGAPRAVAQWYVADVPAPARVIAGYTNGDSLDRMARQLAALSLVGQFLKDLSWDRALSAMAPGHMDQEWTPDEARLMTSYDSAQRWVRKPEFDMATSRRAGEASVLQWFELVKKYQWQDTLFRDDVLHRFFSPEWVSGYWDAKRRHEARRARTTVARRRTETAAHPAAVPASPPVPESLTPALRDSGDFAFWREMPDVARVLNDVQGNGEDETAALRLAVYRVLRACIETNASRVGQLPWPPREQELARAYSQLIYTRERPRVNAPRDQRIMAQSYRFQANRAFVGQFLKRYFSQAAMRDIAPIVTRLRADAETQYADALKENPEFANLPDIEASGEPWRSPTGKPSDLIAADFVHARLDGHWVKTPDGWTTEVLSRRRETDEDARDVLVGYEQYRDISFKVAPQALSEALQLNGIDYRGLVTFQRTAARSYRYRMDGYDGPAGWSDWRDSPFPVLTVERRNGQWSIEDTDLFKGRKPIAARVPLRR